MRIEGDIPISLDKILLALSPSGMLEVMMGALDEMQSYNGQSKMSAICRAMGFDEDCDDEGRSKFYAPSIDELKKRFN